MSSDYDPALARAADYGLSYRSRAASLDAVESAEALRRRFCIPLPDAGRDGTEVIDDLIAAAEPGLVKNTHPHFFAWVMGASDVTGVAADWLTSIWGQNSAIFQTAPAAAIAEEAVSEWLLDLLDLPRTSSVGFVTGATMAGFVGLAAARSEVLAWAGHDMEWDGLQGAPLVRIYVSDDAHASNFAALRFLGFGEPNIVRVPSNDQGLMDTPALSELMAAGSGPQIIIGQAGQINSGGFEDFHTLADLADRHGAWLHIDGAFGLWARSLPEKAHLADGTERAHSWSVDGHKWLQLPYDSGFTIVKHPAAHKRAMDISGGYLNRSSLDGRNPSEFNPELSRRARGFAAWAALQSLGRQGVEEIVRRHCQSAQCLAERLQSIPGIALCNTVLLNQVTARVGNSDEETQALADALNTRGYAFVRTAQWRGRTVLRFSIISQHTSEDVMNGLGDAIQGILSGR